jgi:guanylate kinase
VTRDVETLEPQLGALPGAIDGAPGAMLIIISGPAGVGKDTILDELKKLPSADRRHFVVTYKSRQPRWNEVEGRDYHFVSPERFHEIWAAGGLLEATSVHEQWSGTPISAVRKALLAGLDPVLKIDVQGAATVKRRVPEAFRIFVEPPSLEELRERLEKRGTETTEQLEIRMRNAAREMHAAPGYDRRVVNTTDRAADTARQIDALIEEEHDARVTRRLRV